MRPVLDGHVGELIAMCVADTRAEARRSAMTDEIGRHTGDRSDHRPVESEDANAFSDRRKQRLQSKYAVEFIVR